LVEGWGLQNRHVRHPLGTCVNTPTLQNLNSIDFYDNPSVEDCDWLAAEVYLTAQGLPMALTCGRCPDLMRVLPELSPPLLGIEACECSPTLVKYFDDTRAAFDCACEEAWLGRLQL